MSKITRNQHYISQCVTRNFSNEKEKLFEVFLEKEKVYPTNCIDSMAESFTYEHPSLETNALEHYFGKYETYMGPIFTEISDKIKSFESGTLPMEEIKNTTDKYMKEFLLFYYKSGALLHEFEFDLNKKEDRIPLLLKKIFDSKYIDRLASTISNFYKFTIIKNEEREFLLSDQFMSTAALSIKGLYTNITNRNMGFKGVAILIPISSEYYIMYYEGNIPNYIIENQVNDLDIEQADVFNRIIINNSYKKAICLKREPLERNLKFFNAQSPVGTIMGFKGGMRKSAVIKKEVFFNEELDNQWEKFRRFDWSKHYKKIKRNEPCYCDSGKKLKNCCIDMVVSFKNIMETAFKVRKGQGYLIQVNRSAAVEKAINEFNY